jgi:hypothetical protein
VGESPRWSLYGHLWFPPCLGGREFGPHTGPDTLHTILPPSSLSPVGTRVRPSNRLSRDWGFSEQTGLAIRETSATQGCGSHDMSYACDPNARATDLQSRKAVRAEIDLQDLSSFFVSLLDLSFPNSMGMV